MPFHMQAQAAVKRARVVTVWAAEWTFTCVFETMSFQVLLPGDNKTRILQDAAIVSIQQSRDLAP